MQLISKINKKNCFSLRITDEFSRYPWAIPMKDKKGTTITNAFQKNLKASNCKPNKKCIDKDSKFYNRSMKLWLEENDVDMYSAHNETKYVVTERFIKTLVNFINTWLQYQKLSICIS